MVLLHSEMTQLGAKAPDFALPGTDGHQYSLSSCTNDVVVIMFICNHCPYVKAILDRLINLTNAFEDKSVQFYGISANDVENYPEDNFENMKILAEEKHLPFPYLLDESQETARIYGAVCTPDFFVYDKARFLQYRGRLDDSWDDTSKVSHEDLKNAISNLLNQKLVSQEQKPSMGCSIKWKK